MAKALFVRHLISQQKAIKTKTSAKAFAKKVQDAAYRKVTIDAIDIVVPLFVETRQNLVKKKNKRTR